MPEQDQQEGEIEKLIRERVEQLPENVQDAILGPSFDEKIRTVGTSNQIHIDKFQMLGDLTTIMMLGLSDDEEFPAQLANSLNISREAAVKIANDINMAILVPIQDMMKASPAPQAQAPIVPASDPKPAAPDLGVADTLLTSTNATVNPSPVKESAPAKPDLSKVDPYREPIA